MPADALHIRGRHNALNALAALALATAIGCPLAPMLHALREYRGEPHRVEYVATIDGVDAFDDSKGTNVGATEAALVGLGSERAPAKLVVILGGDGKGQDFAPLAAPLARHARAAVTIGRDAAAIERVVEQAGVPFKRCATFEAAVRAAFARAQPGDAVLLSPACASLDMFRNYEHRAEVFVKTVGELADAALAHAHAGGSHPLPGDPRARARLAREALGPDRLVAPEQAVVLETDPTRAGGLTRAHLATYLGLPNYSNNWLRIGFTDEDLLDGGSDRLVDALVAWGDDEHIAERIQERRATGADHVCVQVLTDDPITHPLTEWRRLAGIVEG